MQQEESLEKLAQALAQALPEGAGPASEETVTDQALRAYLAGEHSDQVERVLAHNAEVRARLQALAGVVMPTPPAGVRDAILATREPAAADTWQPVRRWAAAIVATSLLAIWFVNTGPDVALPELAALDYQISVQGLARARGGAGSPTAFADSTVQVSVIPQVSTGATLTFALYAGQGAWLTPVEPTLITVEGGAADIRFRPDQVVDLNSGRLQIVVLVSPDGSVPARIASVADASEQEKFMRLRSSVMIVER